MPNKEDLALLIVDTLTLSIQEAAEKIIKEGNLEYLTEQDVIETIRSFRYSRKGLETCCDALLAIYRRKSPETESTTKEDDFSDMAGILGSVGPGVWGKYRP